jgi:hypothetical protein
MERLLKNVDMALRFGAAVFILSMAPDAALAYIDPGNGAYMVQALFTLVGAALFYIRHPIRSLRELSRWLFTRFGKSSDARRGGLALDAEGSIPGEQHGTAATARSVSEDR